MPSKKGKLDVLDFTQEGYKPLVFSHDWQVALLNWEPGLNKENLKDIERHNQTDEVFVLWRGRGVMIVIAETGLEVVDMRPGVVYNVIKGTWHTNLSSHDASWVIVENRDTHLNDTELRPLDGEELALIRRRLPTWLEK